MKKVIIALLLLVAILLARGQENNLKSSNQATDLHSYERILKPDSTVWDVAAWDMPGIFMAKIIVRHQPDSAHHPVYFYSDFHTYGEYEYFGRLREDTIQGRLWFTEPTGTDEILIMDMSLNLADSIEIEPGYWTKVDSTYYLNDRKIIRFDRFSETWDENLKFIEGVGPNSGLFYKLYGVDWAFMSCMHLNDELLYQTSSPFFEGCVLNTNSVNIEPGNTGYFIFPNPANSTLMISIDHAYVAERTLTILDINGIILIQRKITEQLSKLNLQSFKTGIYTVIIQTGDSIFREKLIVVK